MKILKLISPWNKIAEITEYFLFPALVFCFLSGDLAVCLFGYCEILLLPLFLTAVVVFVLAVVLKKYKLLPVMALLLGYCWCGTDAANLDNFNYADGRAVEITGVVEDVVQSRDYYLSDISSVGKLGNMQNYIVKGTTAEGWHGKVMVSAVDYDLRQGDKIHLVGNVNRRSILQNPFSANFDYYRFQGIAGYVKAISGELKVSETAKPGFFKKLSDNIREKIYLQTEDLPEKQRQLLKGLAFGDKSTITGSDSNMIAKTGVAHVFAVSGMHIGFVLAFVLGILNFLNRFMQIPKWFKLFAVVFLTVLYASVCGFTYSVIRATVMGLALAVSVIYYNNHNSGLSLLYGAFVCVLIQPFAFCDVGFQLSFIAALALITTCGIWQSLIKSETLAVLVSAQIATAPVVVYNFGILTFSGLLISPMVSGLAGLAVCFGFLAILFSFIGLSSFFLYIAGLIAEIIYKACCLASCLPFSWFAVVKPNAVSVVVCYLLLFGGYCLLYNYLKEKKHTDEKQRITKE